jgi:hypothetical protein
MTAMRDQQRSKQRATAPAPGTRLPVPVIPPKRRPWLLALSAAAVLAWTLFLAWMAWQS